MIKRYDFNRFSLERYLEDKGVKYKRVSGGTELRTQCFSPDHKSGEGDSSGGGKLYIHALGDKKGLFDCKSAECDYQGNLVDIVRHFGDVPEDVIPVGDTVSITRVRTAFSALCERNLSQANREYLINKRGFTRETIAHFHFGEVPRGAHKQMADLGFEEKDLEAAKLIDDQGNFFFRAGALTIPYMISGQVVTVRARNFEEGLPKYVSLPGEIELLYNMDALKSLDKKIYVVEGELDCVTMFQNGYLAVGVAGAGVWENSWTEELSDFDEILVVYDGEDGSYKYSEAVKERLGSKAHAIHMVENMDINDYFKENSSGDFDRLITRALEESFPFKTLDYHFDEWDLYHNSGQTWLKTGYKVIDDSLPVGILPNQLIVWVAKPSVGKSQIALNMLYRQMMLYPEERFLLFSLEMTGYEIFDRLSRIAIFYDLDIESQKKTLETFSDRLHIFDNNTLTRTNLWDYTEQYLEKYGKPKAAYLDYLGYFANAYQGSTDTEKVGRASMDLKAWAKEFYIPMFIPHQTVKGNAAGQELDIDSGADSAKVSASADYMFTMSWPDQGQNVLESERTNQVIMKGVKNRSGPTHFTAKLQRAPFSYVFATEQDKVQKQGLDPYRMALSEHSWSMAGHNYLTALKRHRTGDRDALVTGSSREMRE